MRSGAFATGLGLLAALMSAAAVAQTGDAPVRLVPHRAVYDLSLASSTGSRSVESASGRIAFDFRGDACEGYAMNYRQVTLLETGESGTRTSDLRSVTFEAGDGSSLRFRNENGSGSGPRQEVDGTATRSGNSVGLVLRRPVPADVTLPSAPIFPTAHMKQLIALARSGERTLSVPIYDGSDDGRKVYETLAVIGNRIEPGSGAALEDAARQAALTDQPRWPVSLSYFSPGDGERTPIYVLSFELFENGVSRALRLDYGDFALLGELKSLDVQPLSDCPK